MAYDIDAHNLLSDDALALDPEALLALGRVAELALGLNGYTDAYTGQDLVDLTMAVALTVNHYVAMGPDGWVFTSKGRGAKSAAYRGQSAPPPAPGHALSVVAAVTKGSTWAPFGGYS